MVRSQRSHIGLLQGLIALKEWNMCECIAEVMDHAHELGLLAWIDVQKKEDSTPKGSIDLRASKIDPADELTGKPFSIRIAQSKQVFNYLQASSDEDRDAWITTLRRAAGYRMEKIGDDDHAPRVSLLLH